MPCARLDSTVHLQPVCAHSPEHELKSGNYLTCRSYRWPNAMPSSSLARVNHRVCALVQLTPNQPLGAARLACKHEQPNESVELSFSYQFSPFIYHSPLPYPLPLVSGCDRRQRWSCCRRAYTNANASLGHDWPTMGTRIVVKWLSFKTFCLTHDKTLPVRATTKE